MRGCVGRGAAAGGDDEESGVGGWAKVDDGACTMTLVGWRGGGEEEAEDDGVCSAVDSPSGFGW